MMEADTTAPRRRWVAAAGLGLGATVLGTRKATAQVAEWPPITAYPSGSWSPGRWVWADLFTDDVAASQRFYGAVFGWTFERTAALGGRYLLARANGENIAALVPRQGNPGAERGNRWMPLVSVEDPGRAAREAQAAGGRVVIAPATLPGRGDVAILADPDGTPFGVIRAAGGDPDDYLAEPNEWVWLELWARDPERAAGFYRPLAGYTIEREIDGAGGPHLQLASGGFGRATIRATPFPKLPPAWIAFLRVADAVAAAARVRQAGGRIVVAPRPDLLDSRVAVCADPGGAPFGLLALRKDPA